MKRFIAAFVLLAHAAVPVLAAPPDDPLHSPMWGELATRHFGAARIVFDDRVKVLVPGIVENQAQVPVTADAREIAGVVRLMIFADLNPIQHVLTMTPFKAAPYIGLRIKVEQATPVRAAVLTGDGVWHVGGLFLEASGGGCSAPAMQRKDATWTETLGHAQGRLWREPGGLTRARFRVRHPMDTGLAKDNTPAYFIERVDVRAASGEPLANLEMFEPVSEDPTLTMLFELPLAASGLDIEGRDNNGGIYKSNITAPWRQGRHDPDAARRRPC